MRGLQRVRTRVDRLPDWLVDSGLALLLTGVSLSFLWFLLPRSPIPPWRGQGPTGAAVGITLVATLPIALRRRYPLTVLAIVTLATVAQRRLQLSTGDFGSYVALFAVAAHYPRRHSLVALGLVVVTISTATLWQVHLLHVYLLVFVMLYPAAWALGDRQQTQRALVAELERQRQEKCELAVAGERARIARDLHDVVAHGVSVMVLHTAAARRTLTRDAQRAEEALAQVEATGRQSLTELRRLLGVLREDGQSAELRPQPQLAYLDDLVGQFREAGLPVQVEIVGKPRPLAAGVDLSAYRIVQEALTNTLKHANASTVDVRFRYTERDLHVEIVDDGRATTTNGRSGDETGHGLVGMRERAVLVGGRLEAGPRLGGGFRVAATLPLDS